MSIIEALQTSQDEITECKEARLNLSEMKFQTKAIHAGIDPDPATGAIATPIHQSTTYQFKRMGEPGEFEYSRCGNPTRKALEDNLAALEGGVYSSALATGQGAQITLLNLFQQGDHIICGNDVYGGTIRMLNLLKKNAGIEVSFIPLTDVDRVRTEIRSNTRAIWIESPSNPLFNIVDLEAIATLARENDVISIVDNTLLTPYFQQPFQFGIDLVVHSATKYLSGHNDGLGGVIVCRENKFVEDIAFTANALGAVLGAFDAWLILRGIKTLALRMREQQKSALKIANFLQSHSAVSRVFYPGLADHPQYALIQKQTSGFGGMLSFELKEGIEKARKVVEGTELFYMTESFGGVESLIQHPQTMSHSSMSPEALAEAGITDKLVRVSVGLEDCEDLLADLERALDA